MGKIILAIGLALILIFTIICTLTPWGVSMINNWTYSLQKADDDTSYTTIKKVEDTCRAMITSYTSDTHTYKQYKISSLEYEKELASQAKIRANRTAASYNEYILKNSFIWEDNIPSDIAKELPYIE